MSNTKQTRKSNKKVAAHNVSKHKLLNFLGGNIKQESSDTYIDRPGWIRHTLNLNKAQANLVKALVLLDDEQFLNLTGVSKSMFKFVKDTPYVIWFKYDCDFIDNHPYYYEDNKVILKCLREPFSKIYKYRFYEIINNNQIVDLNKIIQSSDEFKSATKRIETEYKIREYKLKSNEKCRKMNEDAGVTYIPAYKDSEIRDGHMNHVLYNRESSTLYKGYRICFRGKEGSIYVNIVLQQTPGIEEYISSQLNDIKQDVDFDIELLPVDDLKMSYVDFIRCEDRELNGVEYSIIHHVEVNEKSFNKTIPTESNDFVKGTVTEKMKEIVVEILSIRAEN